MLRKWDKNQPHSQTYNSQRKCGLSQDLSYSPIYPGIAVEGFFNPLSKFSASGADIQVATGQCEAWSELLKASYLNL